MREAPVTFHARLRRLGSATKLPHDCRAAEGSCDGPFVEGRVSGRSKRFAASLVGALAVLAEAGLSRSHVVPGLPLLVLRLW
jgi:hypothetical protein